MRRGTVMDRPSTCEKHGGLKRMFLIVLVVLGANLASCMNGDEKQAYEIVREASSNFDDGRYDRVVQGITQAFELVRDGEASLASNNDGGGDWSFQRGRAYAALGNLAKAEEDFTVAIRRGSEGLVQGHLHSTSSAAKQERHYRRFGAYYGARARVRAQLGACSKAIEDYTSAVNWYARGLRGQLDLAAVNPLLLADQKYQARQKGARGEALREMGRLVWERGALHGEVGDRERESEDRRVAASLGQAGEPPYEMHRCGLR